MCSHKLKMIHKGFLPWMIPNIQYAVNQVLSCVIGKFMEPANGIEITFYLLPRAYSLHSLIPVSPTDLSTL